MTWENPWGKLATGEVEPEQFSARKILRMMRWRLSMETKGALRVNQRRGHLNPIQ
jgi:hypothetical protein